MIRKAANAEMGPRLVERNLPGYGALTRTNCNAKHGFKMVTPSWVWAQWNQIVLAG